MKEDYLFEFITIFFIVLLVLYNKTITELSFTTLGKLIAVLLIIFYTIYDTAWGLLMCGIVILYYQCQFFEGLENEIKENFENNINNKTKEMLSPELRFQFEAQFCKKRQLNYKGSNVKTEMADHVFPELQFNSNKCNPCSSDCDYSIIEEKQQERMQNEEHMLKHKDSNGLF